MEPKEIKHAYLFLLKWFGVGFVNEFLNFVKSPYKNQYQRLGNKEIIVAQISHKVSCKHTL